MERVKKILAISAWAITGIAIIVVIIPSVSKLIMMRNDLNNQWIGFQLKDESGRMHTGFADLGFSFMDMELLAYGYQAPPGTDLSKWNVNPKKAEQIDGFEWSDRGFLWHTSALQGTDINLRAGTRLGLDKPFRLQDQAELTLPGAPWDRRSDNMSFLGKFPDYKVKFDDGSVTFDLDLAAAVPAWYMYNEGRPMQCGDFSFLSMNELPVNVEGVITHKKTGESFNVSGMALMEANVGIPWNTTLSYGTHDWTDYYFPGGWSGSMWNAHDDWQWGYNRYPNTGWIWDPELEKFHTFHRVEIIEADYVKDKVSKTEYPQHMLWRGIGTDATLEVETETICLYPNKVSMGVVTFTMAYGPTVSEGRLLRRDGTVVDLGAGQSFMEYYPAIIPDIAFWGPFVLILLTLIWSAYVFISRKIAGRSIAPPIAWCAAGIIAVIILNAVWSI